MKVRRTIKQALERKENSTPVLFVCRGCQGRGRFFIDVHFPEEICSECEGTGITYIPANTTNNPFVLKEFLELMKT